MGSAEDGKQAIHPLWSRRHSTKFNGASYIVQRGAEALYSPKARPRSSPHRALHGQRRAPRRSLRRRRAAVFGGENAPYVWVGCPAGSQAGRCSTRCSTKPMSSSPPAPASAPRAKATSASAPSTAAPTSRKSAAASGDSGGHQGLGGGGFVRIGLGGPVTSLHTGDLTLAECGEELVAVVGGELVGLWRGLGGLFAFIEQVLAEEGEVLANVGGDGLVQWRERPFGGVGALVFDDLNTGLVGVGLPPA
jgi:hypothetical protein